MQHIGMGVPLRAAEHARLRTEREGEEAEVEQPDEAERVEVTIYQGILAGPLVARRGRARGKRFVHLTVERIAFLRNTLRQNDTQRTPLLYSRAPLQMPMGVALPSTSSHVVV